jgi:hypothetical protein
VTAAEFADLPFGGHAGEWLSGQAAPAPPPPQPLVIEPPPWAAEETGPLVPLTSPATGEERLDALAVMRAEDGETSWPEPAGPPEVLPPPLPVAIPPPDWRAEQEERDRVAAREAQERLEATRDPYPARPSSEKAPRWP